MGDSILLSRPTHSLSRTTAISGAAVTTNQTFTRVENRRQQW